MQHNPHHQQLIRVDLDDKGHGTEKQIRKDGFFWDKEVIESNGVEL